MTTFVPTFKTIEDFPKLRLDTSHNPPRVLKGVSSKHSANPTPFVFDLPEKGLGSLILPDAEEVAIPINIDPVINNGPYQPPKWKVLVYHYETGEKKHTFEGIGQILNIKAHQDILFVQLQTWQVYAWNWKLGTRVELPDLWDRTYEMSFSEKFTAHTSMKERQTALGKQKPLEIIISDSKTYKCEKILKTNFFSIHDMAIRENSLYVLGVDDNCSYVRNNFNGACIVKYDNPLSQEPERRKISLVYNVNAVACRAFKLDYGTIFNSKWYAQTNYIWDSNTLRPLLKRESPNMSDNASTLTKVFGDTAVVFDDKGIEIYKKSSNQFSSVKQIEWNTHEAGSSVEIFNFSNETVIAEGYAHGMIRIRNAQTFNIMCELPPPENMVYVLHTKFHKDKLLAHYYLASTEGTIAVLWDLNLQKPALLITRDALKNKNYKSDSDNIHIINEDIFVRSENQVMVYKGALS